MRYWAINPFAVGLPLGLCWMHHTVIQLLQFHLNISRLVPMCSLFLLDHPCCWMTAYYFRLPCLVSCLRQLPEDMDPAISVNFGTRWDKLFTIPSGFCTPALSDGTVICSIALPLTGSTFKPSNVNTSPAYRISRTFYLT